MPDPTPQPQRWRIAFRQPYGTAWEWCKFGHVSVEVAAPFVVDNREDAEGAIKRAPKDDWTGVEFRVIPGPPFVLPDAEPQRYGTVCQRCDGDGEINPLYEDGTPTREIAACPDCGGTGKVAVISDGRRSQTPSDLVRCGTWLLPQAYGDTYDHFTETHGGMEFRQGVWIPLYASAADLEKKHLPPIPSPPAQENRDDRA